MSASSLRRRGALAGDNDPPYVRAVLATPGLQSLWRLNEPPGSLTVEDSGPAGITAAFTPGTGGALGEPGITTDGDTAALLQGGGKIDLGAHYEFPGVDPFSIEFLIRITTTPGGTAMMVANYGPATTDDGWAVFSAGGGGLYFYRYNGGAGSALIAPGEFTIGDEYHIGASFDGADLRSYVNGVLTGASPVANAFVIAASARHAFVGEGNGWNGLEGVYQNIAVYDRALAGAEFAAHYAVL